MVNTKRNSSRIHGHCLLPGECINSSIISRKQQNLAEVQIVSKIHFLGSWRYSMKLMSGKLCSIEYTLVYTK